MRRSLLVLLLISLCFSVSAIDLISLGYNNIDTLETFSAGPGGTYFSVSMRKGDDNLSRLDVWLLRIDTHNPYVSVEEVLAKDAVIGTERPSAMAERKTTDKKIFYGGTNGDFFVTQGDVGFPTGLTIVNREFAYTPSSSSRRLGAVGVDGLGYVSSNFRLNATLSYGDATFKINHFNYKRNANELVLYNQHNGASTGTNNDGTEVLVELLDGEKWATNGKMKVRVTDKSVGVGNMIIPAGQAVLSANGEMQQYLNELEIGTELELDFSFELDGVEADIAQCVGGDNYALIVNNGEVEENNYWNENHPRTAFGQSVNGDTLLFCVVDGRGKSIGCTTQILGAIMQHYGCYKAVNWDGGGSSTLYIRQFGNQMNTGSDGAERAVGNAMFAVANVPEVDDKIARVDAYSPVLSLPRYGVVEPRFLGYNQYGVLLDTEVEGVVLECEDEVGEIIDNKFVCHGSGKLSYHYGEVRGEIEVRLSENVELELRLKSVVVSDDSDYGIEVLGIVGKNIITLLPSALDWQVEDEDIAVVSEQGLLNGLKNGTTRVFALLGEYKDTLEVIVEIPESKPLLWDDMIGFDTRMEMYESSNWGTKFTEVNGKSDLVVNYKSAGRQPQIEFEGDRKMYSTPHYLELRYSASSLPITTITFGFSTNGTETDFTTDPIEVEINKDQSIIINLDSVFNVSNDFSIYPISLTYMAFALDATGEKAEHHLVLDGLYLHYGDDPRIETGVDNVADTNEKQVIKKVMKAGEMYIEKGNELYTITGQKIK